ncbi:MAG: DUF4179 domain-containing protein [Clostridia bacterium]|nr:DUF4179 domain-containing protein [Clostridia bacterium]
MNLHEEQERVQKAVSNSLSHVQEDPWLTQKVLANAKGEEPVKRKISLALVLSIAGILAVMGTAYALFSSRVADFFGQHWNQELGARLQNGKIAQIGESITAGDVVITLDEIVYRDRGLYGVGTVRSVNERVVLLPMDTAELLYESQNEDFHLDDETPALEEYNTAMALVTRTQSSGGKILTVKSMPLKIGVDDGTMLMPCTIGFYDIANENGSLTYSFEASDGFAVNEGTTYQIQMESVVEQIGEKGLPVDGTLQRYEWTISCTPVFVNSLSQSTGDTTSNVSVLTSDGYELITPQEYQKSGTMPIYQAIETDFTKNVLPEWFNTTGVLSGAGTDFIEFNDHAVLSSAPEALFYDEYLGEPFSEACSGAITRIIWIRDWVNHRGEFNLEQTALSGVTLEDAKKQAEEMIARLGLDCNQYICQDALDMSLERIRTMGAIYEKAIIDGELLTDDDWEPYDYSAIPSSEEGFYLTYHPALVDSTDSTHRYELIFFVNSRGIVYAHLRNQFNMGAPVETPEKLISHEEAIANLDKEINRSRYGSDAHIITILRVVLTYESVRASDSAEGMSFVPTWSVIYQDQKAAEQGYDCYSLFNAIDGALIDASFQ